MSSFPDALHHALRDLNRESALKIGNGIYAVKYLSTIALIFCDSESKWKKCRSKKEVRRTQGFCANNKRLRVYTLTKNSKADILSEFETIKTCFEGGTWLKKPRQINVRREQKR